VFVDVGKALAAFQETLVSGRTPFDRFRDALAGRNSLLLEPIPNRRSGAENFSSEKALHHLPFRTQFHQWRVLQHGPLAATLRAGKPIRTPGRNPQTDGKPVQLLGPYNDDKTGTSAARTREASLERAGAGEFKVPSLRNLILTAPYGRDGSVETRAEVGAPLRRYRSRRPAREGRQTREAAEPQSAGADRPRWSFSNPWSTFPIHGAPMMEGSAAEVQVPPLPRGL